MEHILEILAHDQGVLTRRKHWTIRHQLDNCRRKGTLAATLPGIYTVPDPGWEILVLAAAEFRPGCVITGAAAAKLLWWPECPITDVSVAITHAVGSYAGFCWERRAIPPDLVTVRNGLRIACPALSVLDLIPTLGGEVIDQALRRRAVTLEKLWATLNACPGRPGNRQRHLLLEDSRDRPWSEAERDTHRLLRNAGITGFRTNFRVETRGHRYYLDVAFPDRRLALEIDGWAHHRGKESFVNDRWRLARVAAAGWTILPFAASAIAAEPDEVVALVRAALGLLA